MMERHDTHTHKHTQLMVFFTENYMQTEKLELCQDDGKVKPKKYIIKTKAIIIITKRKSRQKSGRTNDDGV